MKIMNSNPARFIFPIFFVTISTITAINGINPKYEECKKNVMCHDNNVTYPFYSSDRSQYCGYPGFKLEECHGDDSQATISINNHTYIVLRIHSNTFTVARNDSWLLFNNHNHSCQSLFNTTLDFTRFDYTPTDQNISFFYHCDMNNEPPKSIPPSLIVHCPSDDAIIGYYMTKKLEAEHGGMQTLLRQCQSHLFIPVLEEYVEHIEYSLNVDDVITAFKHGFELRWKAEDDLCLGCMNSGGVCGSDDVYSEKSSTNATFVCHCADKSYKNEACPIGSGSSTHRNIIIGVSVGAAAIAALLCACLVFRQRKKKQLLGASNAAGKSKDITSTTAATAAYTISGGVIGSSNGYTTTPTTNYSQSTSSYVSSRSDIEKGRGGGGGGLGRDDSSYFGVQLFSYEELEEATSHFDEARELGDGGFGTVYYGKLTDGRLVAVKRLYENSVKRIGQFMNEIEILARLRHKNLVTLYGCTSRRSRELLLVYEYISNGTVADHLHGKLSPHHSSSATKTHHLPWQTRLKIAIETAEALAFLHERDVIHRDVKTTNILLDQHFCVKVADFGLCRLFPTDVTHVSTAPQGTPGYVDPEYYQCYRLTEKSDVFSFGVVLIELISSKQAVDITRHRHHINLSNMALDKIQNHQLDELVDPVLGYREDCSVDKMVTGVAELAFMCLQQERDMRPTMGEVLDALIEIKKSVDGDKLQEVLVVGHTVGGCKEEEEDAELLKNVPPPLSPEESKGGGPRV